jgi:hypothetical protein
MLFLCATVSLQSKKGLNVGISVHKTFY